MSQIGRQTSVINAEEQNRSYRLPCRGPRGWGCRNVQQFVEAEEQGWWGGTCMGATLSGGGA